jgi:hypothetical protein
MRSASSSRRSNDQTFGGDGFDISVDKVSALEKELGVYDLSQLTLS